MSALNIKDLLGTVLDCLELHMRTSAEWHYGDPTYESDEIPEVQGVLGLRELVMRQHWVLFRLHEAREQEKNGFRVERLEEKLGIVTWAIDSHLDVLLNSMGHACSDLGFGAMIGGLSELSLETHHRREEAKIASGNAAHEPGNERLARQAEGLLEKVGELDTLRMVQGREMLDALVAVCVNDSK
ncbi:MAG: hypothetical protein KKB70_03480 [Proteobacteria bacterium]|nr:hypothetical protein [Pseudomonadota bacterium]